MENSTNALTRARPLPHTEVRSFAAEVTPISYDRWTTEKQVHFLRELSATHSVSKAARSAGMSRQSAYALRARLKGEPFDLAWAAAFRCRFDALAEAAMDRALNGVEVPHLYKGEVVHTSRKYDERLTAALLALRGTFRSEGTVTYGLERDYSAAEFGQMVERVENGPETWEEERQIQIERLYEAEDCSAYEDDPGKEKEEWE